MHPSALTSVPLRCTVRVELAGPSGSCARSARAGGSPVAPQLSAFRALVRAAHRLHLAGSKVHARPVRDVLRRYRLAIGAMRRDPGYRALSLVMRLLRRPISMFVVAWTRPRCWRGVLTTLSGPQGGCGLQRCQGRGAAGGCHVRSAGAGPGAGGAPAGRDVAAGAAGILATALTVHVVGAVAPDGHPVDGGPAGVRGRSAAAAA